MDVEQDNVSADGNPSGVAERRFPVRTWFIPLEDPLNLPQGYVVELPRTRSPLDPVWFEELHDQLRRIETMVSLKIWHLETGLAGLREKSGLAFEACQRAFPMYLSDQRSTTSAEDVDWPDLALPATVVETSISIHRNNVTDEAFAAALEEAVQEIQRLQRVNGYVTGRPVRPLSLQALPPYVPIATASVGGSGFETDGDMSVYLLTENIRQLPSRRDFDDVEMQMFVSFFHRSSGAFGGFLASQSEARAALLHRGDARSSLLASATACEVFLDDFLKHLLWEKRRTPEDCLPIFVDGAAITTVQGRTRRELGNLVGGNWNDKTQPDLNNWQSQVAHLRHRTIHGGPGDPQSAVAAVGAQL